MSITVILIPFIVIALIFILIYGMNKPNKMMKSKTNKIVFRMNRNTHSKTLLVFIALLIVLTITVELMDTRSKSVESTPKLDVPFYEFENSVHSLEEQIMNSEKTDPALLMEKRTHLAGETLTIHRNGEPFDGPYVYIERKSENDQTIEEFIYKPILIVDDYDLSDMLEAVIPVPVWSEYSVTFPEIKHFDITLANFQEATILKQLTKDRSHASVSMGYGSTSRPHIVHLIVPKDLEVIDLSEELNFVDK